MTVKHLFSEHSHDWRMQSEIILFSWIVVFWLWQTATPRPGLQESQDGHHHTVEQKEISVIKTPPFLSEFMTR